MKKTNSMRVAVAMLALTLITSCFVGGTFAKYTTSASGGDSARVAKFGVEVNAGKSTFLKEYETHDAEYTGTYSVVSSDGDKVVAPGTSGKIDLFSISGTPEVAVRVTTKMTHDDKNESVWLNPINSFTKVMTIKVTVAEWELGESTNIGIGSGTDDFTYETEKIPGKSTTTSNVERGDAVSADEYETRPTADTEKDTKTDEWEDWGITKGKDTTTETITDYEPEYDLTYYPLKWTLKKDNAPLIESGKLSDIKDYFDDERFNKVYGPGNALGDISGTYTLEWEWPFEDTVATDKYDTALGNIMAGIYGIYEEGEFNLNEAFKFDIKVEQVD